MKIIKLTATINGIKIDATLSDGINFVFYKNESEKKFYKKAFELAFDAYYHEDDFYKNNDVEVEIEINDANIDYTLLYGSVELCESRELMEGLLIEGKNVNVWCNEICKGLIKSYLKKNGYSRVFDCDDYINMHDPHYLIEMFEKKNKNLGESMLAELYNCIKNIKPVFINKKRTARLMLLSNGELFIEGENKDDDEQYVLAEYFKFAITAQISDVIEKLDCNAYGYPLFICELFEGAGNSADIITILEVLKGYQGQTIFLCPHIMEKLFKDEKIVSLTEEMKEMILPF